jgi:copper chaperone CopZ
MKQRFQVENMKCGGCVATVQKALQGLQGCEKAEVDLNSGTAEVEGSVDREQLVKVLDGLGYPARPRD